MAVTLKPQIKVAETRNTPSADAFSSRWLETVLVAVNSRRITVEQAALLMTAAQPSPAGDVLITDALHGRLAGWLQRVIDSGTRARGNLSLAVNDVMREVRCRPIVIVKPTGIRLEYEAHCRDIVSAAAYAVCLLLDESLDFGKRLGRCVYCENFFLAQRKTGRRRTRYCSDEHMGAADRAKGAERVAASRKGISVKQWRAQQTRMGTK